MLFSLDLCSNFCLRIKFNLRLRHYTKSERALDRAFDFVACFSSFFQNLEKKLFYFGYDSWIAIHILNMKYVCVCVCACKLSQTFLSCEIPNNYRRFQCWHESDSWFNNEITTIIPKYMNLYVWCVWCACMHVCIRIQIHSKICIRNYQQQWQWQRQYTVTSDQFTYVICGNGWLRAFGLSLRQVPFTTNNMQCMCSRVLSFSIEITIESVPFFPLQSAGHTTHFHSYYITLFISLYLNTHTFDFVVCVCLFVCWFVLSMYRD